MRKLRKRVQARAAGRSTSVLKWAAVFLVGVIAPVTAIGQDLLPQLREEIVTVKKPGLFSIELEATLYRPAGEGPFPLVVINHGKALGNPRFQARARYPDAAREFVQRGYAVVIPMRQGFSKSGGSYIGGGCNVESNGLVQASDVQATLAQVSQRADIDARRVVVVGQSHGGFTTMALGSLSLPNVAGLINFAGGLRQENCNGWERALADAMGSYARKTTVPSLWFYGSNDSYFPVAVWQEMHTRYVSNGGRARMVAFGAFGSDSHQLFGSARGVPVWLPEVESFFKELGLPFEKTQNIALAAHEAEIPAETGFAEPGDVAAIPYLKVSGRSGYEQYRAGNAPKAFAIGATGAWAWKTGSHAMTQALEACAAVVTGQACKLYAVDDRVVWVVD